MYIMLDKITKKCAIGKISHDYFIDLQVNFGMFKDGLTNCD